MANTSDQTLARLQGAKDDGDVREDLDRLRRDMETLVRDVSVLAKREVKDGVAAVEGAADQVEAHANQLADHARSEVRKNPLGSCAAAAGAGFVLGILMSR